MGRYFIAGIILYALVVAVYLLRERWVKHRKNAARKKGFNPFRVAPQEDIIGKSHFTLRQSEPQHTTLEISEKQTENAFIFANKNGQAGEEETTAVNLQTQTEGGNVPALSGDNSGEIDILIDNEPEGEFESDEDGDIDTWESEDAEDAAGSNIAQGIGFEELAGMLRTVKNAEAATGDEREQAGRVLVEIRKTEIIEQVALDEPKKKVVSSLMDEYFAAYNRRKGTANEPTVKALADFNPRSFA